jgi:arginyl-tRNA synthetase
VGIGAVIFNDLYNSRIKDVTFSWEKILNFEGETGPYVQYTCARANSVLEKAGFTPDSDIDYSKLADGASFDIVKLLYSYPDRIAESAEKYEPYIITRHLVDIAQAFNYFYHENPVLNADDETKKARLNLVYAVRAVLKSGLSLIGVDAPEKM